jgi:hypothetical protein
VKKWSYKAEHEQSLNSNSFRSNWLIQDTFTFDIEATTYLTRSNEAGITFKLVYNYYHYANSYSEGLGIWNRLTKARSLEISEDFTFWE